MPDRFFLQNRLRLACYLGLGAACAGVALVASARFVLPSLRPWGGTMLLVGLGIFIAANTAHGYLEGEAGVLGSRTGRCVYRADSPVGFWTSVIFSYAAAVGCIIMAAWIFLKT